MIADGPVIAGILDESGRTERQTVENPRNCVRILETGEALVDSSALEAMTSAGSALSGKEVANL